MMPDFIITKEKIIKAKLEVEGFIAKWENLILLFTNMNMVLIFMLI
jgi:hypothetical protein